MSAMVVSSRVMVKMLGLRLGNHMRWADQATLAFCLCPAPSIYDTVLNVTFTDAFND